MNLWPSPTMAVSLFYSSIYSSKMGLARKSRQFQANCGRPRKLSGWSDCSSFLSTFPGFVLGWQREG
jgi:hypothetical protein